MTVVLVQLIGLEAERIRIDPINLDSRIAEVLDSVHLVFQVVEEFSLHDFFVLSTLIALFTWIEPKINRYKTTMLNDRLCQRLHSFNADLILF